LPKRVADFSYIDAGGTFPEGNLNAADFETYVKHSLTSSNNMLRFAERNNKKIQNYSHNTNSRKQL